MPNARLAASLAALSIFSAAFSQGLSGYMVEGEAFQFKGKWVVEKSSECLATAMLRVYSDKRVGGHDDAITALSIREAGKYNVWVRSQDVAESSRPRSFTLSVDNITLAPAGTHGHNGFYWESVGVVELEKKDVLLCLADTGGYFGRCDAILFLPDLDLDPNTLTNNEIAQLRRNPLYLDSELSTLESPALDDDRDLAGGYTVIATAANDNIRISFVKLTDGSIVCKNDYHDGVSWRRFGGSAEDNRIAIISNEKLNSVNYNQFYPAWNETSAARIISFGGNDYPVVLDGDYGNPYFSGNLTEARAKSVTKTDEKTIKVTYDCGGLGELTAYWNVPEAGSHISVRMLFKPTAGGSYSIALHSAKGLPESKVNSLLMPPMFNGNAAPATPQMLFSSMMTQCLAMIETSGTLNDATSFVAADLDHKFGNEWGSYDYSPVGFSLRNSRNELQPVAIAPAPGMKDSKVNAGKTLEVCFKCGIMNGDIRQTLDYIATDIFDLHDYRQPYRQSLTSTFYNIAALCADDNNSGWAPSLKAYWDIEANGIVSPTGVQSSPLSLLAAAMMGDNEELYRRRALPSIEYMLSRPGYRTVANSPRSLNPFDSQFPTSAYEGINGLTGGLNPWISELALPDNQIRYPNGYFSILQPFSQYLAAYRLTGDDSYLESAMTEAQTYISSLEAGMKSVSAPNSFYHSQMTSDWGPLLDLYRVTGNEAYLQAADKSATSTIAAIKTWPKVAQGSQVVHPGGSYDGVTTIWWRGEEQYRLGFPRKEGDSPEHTVDASLVSSVGLSIEQPATYFQRVAGRTVRPIYMSSWAPRLLELSALAQQPILQTYARNAVIGRADNYPGYYATGYTDITASEDFPYSGPDVSSIYYHHIPAYMGMIQDYLVTEFITRANGNINLPSSRQEGFVWFSNNLYGRGEGEFFGNKGYLWMPDGRVTADNSNVNILTARNDRSFFILLTADAGMEEKTTLVIPQSICKQLNSNSLTIYLSDGTLKETSFESDRISVDVPSDGVVMLAIEANWDETPEIPSLTNGMTVIESGSEAGKIYIYRIRSPFGWDSIFTVAECSEISGLEMQVECDGEKSRSFNWPYECSFTDIPYQSEPIVKITILRNGKVLSTLEHCFADIDSGVGNLFNPDTTGNVNYPDGIYSIDGQKLDKATLPGIYIINGHKRIIR
jgi:hypothetical protein